MRNVTEEEREREEIIVKRIERSYPLNSVRDKKTVEGDTDHWTLTLTSSSAITITRITTPIIYN